MRPDEITTDNVGETIRGLEARTATIPNNLPPRFRGFRDRNGDTATTTRIVTDPGNVGGCAVMVSGVPGVGCSAFIVHWAYESRALFPDGILHLDYDDYRVDGAVSTQAAFAQLLTTLGVQRPELAADLPGLKAQFRRLTRDKRVLVLIDHAHNAADVTELCPPSPGSALLATSFRRDRFAHDLKHMSLKPLPKRAARELVRDRIGADRADAEPDAVTELVELCEAIPQALLIALASMRYDEDIEVRDVVADLKSDVENSGAAGDRDAILNAVADRSYRALPATAAFLLRALAWHPGPDVSRDAIDAFGRRHDFNALDALGVLLDHHLLDRHKPKRYRLSPILRDYARRRSWETDGDDAESRTTMAWADWYTATASAADHAITPDRNRLFDAPATGTTVAFDTAEQARSWLDAEQHILLDVQRRSYDLGRFTAVMRLGEPMWLMYIGNRDIAAFRESMELSLAAAIAAHHAAATVRFRTFLARALMEDGRFAAAGHELDQARQDATVADVDGELLASATEFTGRWHAYQDHHREAIEWYRGARELFAAEADRPDAPEAKRRANRRGVALQDHFIGRCLLRLAESPAAVERLRQAETGMAGVGSERDLATIRTDLGEALRRDGDVAEAFVVVTAAVALLAGEKWYRIEAAALWQLVYVAEERDDTDLRLDCLRRLRNLYEQSGDARIDEVERRLAGSTDG